jgi:hypothetical protein
VTVPLIWNQLQQRLHENRWAWWGTFCFISSTNTYITFFTCIFISFEICAHLAGFVYTYSKSPNPFYFSAHFIWNFTFLISISQFALTQQNLFWLVVCWF